MLNLFVHLGCHGDETACVTVGTEVRELRLYRGGLAVAVKVDDEGQRAGVALIGRSLDCVATRFTGRKIDCFPVQNLGGAVRQPGELCGCVPAETEVEVWPSSTPVRTKYSTDRTTMPLPKRTLTHCYLRVDITTVEWRPTHRVVRPLESTGLCSPSKRVVVHGRPRTPGSRNRLGGLPESGAGLAVYCWCEGSGPERAQIPWTFQKAAAPGAGGAVQSAWDTGFWAV